MKQTFKLKKGEILFDEDKIIIKDEAKKQKWIVSAMLCCGTLIGISTFEKYYKTGDQAEYWAGIFIGLLNISVLILLLLRSVSSEISLFKVKSMKVKQRNGNKFLDIVLCNNRLRRVIGINNESELEEFIRTNIRSKLNCNF